MSDLISKGELFNRLASVWTIEDAYAVIQDMPTEEGYKVQFPDKDHVWIESKSEPIKCKDCAHWDSENGRTGYCMAAKHLFMSRHWEISIYRTYDAEFFCGDAERREEE